MDKINLFFKNYASFISYSIAFINLTFGYKDVLLKKNEGKIKVSDFQLKNSKIKAFAFHGNGCFFKFKNYAVNVEFIDNDLIGFTEWDFFNFCLKNDNEVTEDLVKYFLSKKIEEGILIKVKDVIIFN